MTSSSDRCHRRPGGKECNSREVGPLHAGSPRFTISGFELSFGVRHLIDQIRERLQGEFIQNEVGCAGTKVRE